MTARYCTETVIAELIDATYGNSLTAREKYVYKESLRNLVRLAKAELTLEMKTSIRKLVGPMVMPQARQKTKASQRLEILAELRQRQFEFNQDD